MPKKAFVTGGAGFIGINLIKLLLDEGWEVTALHWASSDLTYLGKLPVKRKVGSVTDLNSLVEAFPNDIDTVFHLASCPYIAVFDPDRVEEQLDIATRQYLEENTIYDSEKDRVEVTRLMSWFRGDFGGVSGAVQMLRDYGVIPADADPSVSFDEYDWTLELGNYQEL